MVFFHFCLFKTEKIPVWFMDRQSYLWTKVEFTFKWITKDIPGTVTFPRSSDLHRSSAVLVWKIPARIPSALCVVRELMGIKNPPVIIPGLNSCLSLDSSSLSALKVEMRLAPGSFITSNICQLFNSVTWFTCSMLNFFLLLFQQNENINQYIGLEKYYWKYRCSNVYSVSIVQLHYEKMLNKQ